VNGLPVWAAGEGGERTEYRPAEGKPLRTETEEHLITMLRDLVTRLGDHFKLAVSKHYSPMVADAEARRTRDIPDAVPRGRRHLRAGSTR